MASFAQHVSRKARWRAQQLRLQLPLRALVLLAVEALGIMRLCISCEEWQANLGVAQHRPRHRGRLAKQPLPEG